MRGCAHYDKRVCQYLDTPSCIMTQSHITVLLSVILVRNSKFFTTFGTTGSQYAATILCCHSLTETMLVYPSPVVGLECSFHFCILVFVLWLVHDRAFGVLRSSGCKVTKIIPFGETFPVFFCAPFLRLATS